MTAAQIASFRSAISLSRTNLLTANNARASALASGDPDDQKAHDAELAAAYNRLTDTWQKLGSPDLSELPRQGFAGNILASMLAQLLAGLVASATLETLFPALANGKANDHLEGTYDASRGFGQIAGALALEIAELGFDPDAVKGAASKAGQPNAIRFTVSFYNQIVSLESVTLTQSDAGDNPVSVTANANGAKGSSVVLPDLIAPGFVAGGNFTLSGISNGTEAFSLDFQIATPNTERGALVVAGAEVGMPEGEENYTITDYTGAATDQNGGTPSRLVFAFTDAFKAHFGFDSNALFASNLRRPGNGANVRFEKNVSTLLASEKVLTWDRVDGQVYCQCVTYSSEGNVWYDSQINGFMVTVALGVHTVTFDYNNGVVITQSNN